MAVSSSNNAVLEDELINLHLQFSLYLCAAMRKLEHIRTVIAVLLLSVVLQMTLMLPFHHHGHPDQEEPSCELCEHHEHHPAHLSSSAQPDNCLICQFLGVSYLPEASAEAPAATQGWLALHPVLSNEVPFAELTLLSTRAPPHSFC